LNTRVRIFHYLGGHLLAGVLSLSPALLRAQAVSVRNANAKTLALTVPSGTPIQIALNKEVRLKKIGQVIHGRVVQPIYVFNHLVIPVGTEATGRIVAIEPVSAKTRTLAVLNADFTPTHQFVVAFNDLAFADGTHMTLSTTVAAGSGQIIRLVSAGEHDKKKNAMKDAAGQKKDQAKQKWQDAMKQVQEPGKMHRALRLATAQLPIHPQYIDAGTLYFAELQEPLQFGSEELTAKAESKVGTPPPPGSLVQAQLVTPLNSATSKQGETVEALLTQPLFDKDQLILPQGSRLRGSVLQVHPARRLHHNGQLRITFHELVLPDGTVQQIDTSLQGIQSGAGENVHLDAEGGAQATAPASRYLSTGVSVGLALIGSGGQNDVGEAGPVAGGATAFKLVGITIGLIVRSHNLGIVMSAYGGGRAIYSNFLGRGRNIVFPKNTSMEIGFGEPTQPSATSLPAPQR
jgi:hypothetical protein